MGELAGMVWVVGCCYTVGINMKWNCVAVFDVYWYSV